MAHDSTKVVMGATKNTFKVVTSLKGALEAGTFTSLKSDGTPSILKADGAKIGVSLGKDLSNAGFMALVRAGLEVPVLLTAAFTPVVGAQVFVSDTTGLAIASGAGATGVNAVYRSAVLTGLGEDGVNTKTVALIDFPGGL